ncbi:MarR family transcriptional regulator [Aquamicrobium sp.]|uniref:MarR family winged helix-turn-helix transcriptional regulator n=1 Tax=Aquamicrobium sp. TaxID=1872579 RepID=UPI0025851699|nr:MarR family transcriptional regulator [Aquamicrobium sp.]MCK9549172.1 MarR family transcriptional regulator [Aquamicrobium sp.]
MKTDAFAFHSLHLAHQAAKTAFDSELSPTQYLVLKAIRDIGDGVNQITLVQSTGIDRSTMADVLRRLAKIGMIKRRRSQKDTRSVQSFLTDEGRQALLGATEAAARANDLILGAIPQSQRRAFLANLERIGKGPVREVKEAA